MTGHVAIERRGPKAMADDRTLGCNGLFIRAHAGPSAEFETPEAALAAGRRATNRAPLAKIIANPDERFAIRGGLAS